MRYISQIQGDGTEAPQGMLGNEGEDGHADADDAAEAMNDGSLGTVTMGRVRVQTLVW